jgi:hypothetical protein
MSEIRQDPYGRSYEVDEDGTFAVWRVTWEGVGDPLTLSRRYLSVGKHTRLLELRERHLGRFWKQEEPTHDDWLRPDPIPAAFSCSFVHKSMAELEYNRVRQQLQKVGIWEHFQERLHLEEDERLKWDDIFGPNAVWLAEWVSNE